MVRVRIPFILALLVACCIGGCGREPRQPAGDPNAALMGIRDTLVRLGAEDQAGRDSVATAVASNDTVFIKRLSRGDSLRSVWLRQVVAKHGWPRRSTVGDTAAGAAWLIVQHSPLLEFQEAMLPVLEAEARRNEVSPADVAMLADRIAVNRHRPQRYGTQFSVQGSRLIAHPILDVRGLDSIRMSVGLPPMTEYVELMAQMYRMPVEWPPQSAEAVKR